MNATMTSAIATATPSLLQAQNWEEAAVRIAAILATAYVMGKVLEIFK